LERALLHRREGQIILAKRDLRDAISELEATRQRLPDEDLRISYFANGQRVFEELISILAEEGRGHEAFQVVEQARARELLDSLAPRPRRERPELERILRPLDAEQIVAALPEDLAILEYLVLEDRLLIWTVSRKGVALHTIEVSAKDLEESTSELFGALKANREVPVAQKGLDLYGVLFGSVVNDFERPRTIVVIPDKFLSSFPFGGLRDSRDGRYLIEKHRLVVAPSATLFVQSLRRDAALADGTPLSALVIGNPVQNAMGGESLGDLAGAVEEVGRIARLFATGHTLLGREATKARFIELAPSHDIIHFAGHSILNPSRPGYSSLVFAPGSGSETGLLYAHELRRVRFSRSRLIFLAACETAAGLGAGGEGTLSLARAFLAAGIPAAIGTLWPVEDAAAVQVTSRFYRHLLADSDAATALQSAQLELLHSSDESLHQPRSWAPFQLIGATTLGSRMKGGIQ
jgi:CHAT domain-containing protein